MPKKCVKFTRKKYESLDKYLKRPSSSSCLSTTTDTTTTNTVTDTARRETANAEVPANTASSSANFHTESGDGDSSVNEQEDMTETSPLLVHRESPSNANDANSLSDESDSGLKDAKTQRIRRLLEDPLIEVYFNILHSFANILCTTNLTLQKNEPQIHRLLQLCQQTVLSCVRRFCHLQDEEMVDLDLENIKRRQGTEVKVEIGARTLLRKLIASGEITNAQEQKVYHNAALYMEAVVGYLIRNLPLKDDFLKTVQWIDPDRLQTAEYDDVFECAMRYRKVFDYTDVDIDQMEDNFYALKRHTHLITTTQSVTQFWKQVHQLEGGRYKNIADLAVCLLIIPHSNAPAERVFSQINQNLQPSHKRLSKETMLNNIMLVKCGNLKEDFMPFPELISKAKRATYLALKNDSDSESD